MSWRYAVLGFFAFVAIVADAASHSARIRLKVQASQPLWFVRFEDASSGRSLHVFVY